ncbi:RNA polymerase sigma factor [Streptomyces sp. NPDC001492]
MPEEFREEFAPDGDLPADNPEQTELSSAGLLSLEADLALGTRVRESAPARAARLEADQRLVDILRGDDFEGPRYEKAAAGWWSYSWRTMVKWTGNGEVFRRSRLAGRPVASDMITTTWSQDDRHQVATEAVIGGMELFRERGLIQGGWNPHGGASLTTYAVGAAIRAFRPAYIAWFRGRQMGQAELDTGPGHGVGDEPQRDIPDQRATDPYYAAAINDELARILPHITDPQVREALGWRAMGYSQAEAAERVGLTEKALERRTSRTRVRIRDTYLRQPELGEGGAR